MLHWVEIALIVGFLQERVRIISWQISIWDYHIYPKYCNNMYEKFIHQSVWQNGICIQCRPRSDYSFWSSLIWISLHIWAAWSVFAVCIIIILVYSQGTKLRLVRLDAWLCRLIWELGSQTVVFVFFSFRPEDHQVHYLYFSIFKMKWSRFGQWACLIMPPTPTSKKLEGHIASGTFVRPSMHPLRFLMHSIASEPCMLGFWNFIYGFFMTK